MNFAPTDEQKMVREMDQISDYTDQTLVIRVSMKPRWRC